MDKMRNRLHLSLLLEHSFSREPKNPAVYRGFHSEALEHLAKLSRVQIGSDPEEHRYTIHRFIETFLLNEAINMEIISLTDAQSRANYFQQGILTNLQYWLTWVGNKMADVAALEREWNNILRAILFAFELDEAWSSTYKLVNTFSPYMERRGHWEMWNRVLTQAIEAARHNEDVASEVVLLALLARLSYQQSRLKEAVAYYRQTIRRARQIGDRFNEARACTNLGYYYVDQGYWYRAEVLCCYALKLFEQLYSDHGRAHTENHLGILYTRQHRWVQAQQYLERACEIWRTKEDEHGLMRGFINLGGLYIRREQPDEALGYLEKALDLAKLTGDETNIGIIYINMGHANIISGDLVKAEAYTRQAETIFRQFSNPAELARVWGNLGTIYSRQGKWNEATLHLGNSLEAWRNLKNKINEINTLIDMIEYELVRGNLQRAEIRLKEVEQLVEPDHEKAQYRHFWPRLAKYRRSLTEQLLQQAATD